MRVVVCSVVNPVSKRVFELLVEGFGFREVGLFNGLPFYRLGDFVVVQCREDVLFLEGLDKLSELGCVEFVVVPSTHRSGAGVPSFTAHPVGVFGSDLSHGGKANCLGFVDARVLSSALKLLDNHSFGSGVPVVFEVTHHGPFYEFPVVFVEVGPGDELWSSDEFCRVIVKVVFDLLNLDLSKVRGECVIGFGGQHYAGKFSKLVFEGSFLFGHMCPRYALPLLDEGLVRQMVERTFPRPVAAVFDKNGTTRKSFLKSCLKDLGLEVFRL